MAHSWNCQQWNGRRRRLAKSYRPNRPVLRQSRVPAASQSACVELPSWRGRKLSRMPLSVERWALQSENQTFFFLFRKQTNKMAVYKHRKFNWICCFSFSRESLYTVFPFPFRSSRTLPGIESSKRIQGFFFFFLDSASIANGHQSESNLPLPTRTKMSAKDRYRHRLMQIALEQVTLQFFYQNNFCVFFFWRRQRYRVAVRHHKSAIPFATEKKKKTRNKNLLKRGTYQSKKTPRPRSGEKKRRSKK